MDYSSPVLFCFNNYLPIRFAFQNYMEHQDEGLVQMMFLFKQVVFRFHVNFQGCKISYPPYTTNSLPGIPKRKGSFCNHHFSGANCHLSEMYQGGPNNQL